MDYNLLLTYLTEIGGGRWEHFKNACQTLAQTIDEEDRGTMIWNIAQRNLSRLGHVEFQFDERFIWRVAPPALVSVPQKDELRVILCGARNLPFIDRVREASGALGKELRIHSQPEGPDVVIVNDCSPLDARRLAEELDILWTDRAVACLFACLPSLDEMLEICQEDNPPIGWRVEGFDVDSFKWEQASQTSDAWLYRYSSTWQPTEYRLKINGRILKVPPFVGIYHVIRSAGKQAIFYDSQKRILSVKAAAKTPELYERAATLCSGFLPVFEPSTLCDKFRDVPRKYAEVVAVKLSQPLEG
jgi:hypothetical protein